MDGWTYRKRYVRCGKANCACALGFGTHGPYWYAYRHRGGRMETQYCGKGPLPQDAEAKSTRGSRSRTAPPPPADSYREPDLAARWVRPKRMDGESAMRILGFTVYPRQTDLYKRYRELAAEHHPDHGGDVRVMVALNLAYAYLRK